MNQTASKRIQSTTFIFSIFRGIGQVMFQNNSISGLLFLIGIGYNSLLMGLAALIGTLTSTVFAKLVGYSQEDIDNGLYGFNGTLVGLGVWVFFEVNMISVLGIILGSICSSVIMNEMKKRIPAYTAPFILSTWLVILVIKYLNLTPFLNSTTADQIAIDFTAALGTSFGQVMFQANVITGIFFLAGIAVNSRKAALYAFYGAALGSLIAFALSFPISSINTGIWGYNAVLCAIALGENKWKGFLLATFAIALSVPLNSSLATMGIITLTAPFVLATWITLLSNKLIAKIKKPQVG